MQDFKDYAENAYHLLNRHGAVKGMDIATEYVDKRTLRTGLQLSPRQRERTIAAITEDIEQHWPAIRRWINKKRSGIAKAVLPVSQYYFDHYDESRGVTDPKEALKYLALLGNKTAGLLSPTPDHQLLWAVYSNQVRKSGDGKVTKSLERDLALGETGMISVELALELLEHAMDAEGRHTEFIEKIRHSEVLESHRLEIL